MLFRELSSVAVVVVVDDAVPVPVVVQMLDPVALEREWRTSTRDGSRLLCAPPQLLACKAAK